MSVSIFVLGESGTGKTTSLRNMNPAETLLIQSIRKPLPFRSDWQPRTRDNPKGNIIVQDQSERIVDLMHKAPHPVIVIDDYQYILANEFMNRVSEKSFEKFNDIGRHAWEIVRHASMLPDHKRVYILSHTETTDHGKTKAKTIGRLLDEKITLEGMFTIVLRTAVINGQYVFSTRNNGSDTVKTPLDMFESEHIENDLQAVDHAITEYYGITATN